MAKSKMADGNGAKLKAQDHFIGQQSMKLDMENVLGMLNGADFFKMTSLAERCI